MNIVEIAVPLLGLSPTDEPISRLLDELEITERPVYEDNPIKTLGKKDLGFSLQFEGKAGHDETYGASAGKGDMVLCQVRLYGPLNTEKYSPYSGKLPYGLKFEQSCGEILELLGNPDMEDEPGTPRRTMIWSNHKGHQLGIVLTDDEKHMRYIDLLRVMI